MNLEGPWRTVLAALDPGADGSAPAIGPGSWHVLFSGRQRPLLMPQGSYPLQEKCLSYFVRGRLNTLYAKALLRANALFPSAGFLPTLKGPQPAGAGPVRRPGFPESPYAAIQIGTTGPFQKASMLFLSEQGDGLALAKLAMTDTADPMIECEVGWLRRLAMIEELADYIPIVLDEGIASSGRRYLVMTLAPGTAATRQFTPAHAKFLAVLGRSRLHETRFGESACFEYLTHTLAQLEPYVPSSCIIEFRAAIDDCAHAIGSWAGPHVVAHGDFAPWNVCFNHQQVFVFDWEYAADGANAIADFMHYFLIQRALSKRPIRDAQLARIMAKAREFAGNVYPEWQWDGRVISGLTLAYLLQVMLHYSWASKRFTAEHPVICEYGRLLARRSEWWMAE
jgi:hypothetical protein